MVEYFPSTFGDGDLQGIGSDTKLPLYIHNRWFFAGWMELFLVHGGVVVSSLRLCCKAV